MHVPVFDATMDAPERTADLALLHIGARGAPALELDEAASAGTPIATIGFGRGSTLDGERPGPLEPAIRRGVIRRTGLLGPEDDPGPSGRRSSSLRRSSAATPAGRWSTRRATCAAS